MKRFKVFIELEVHLFLSRQGKREGTRLLQVIEGLAEGYYGIVPLYGNW